MAKYLRPFRNLLFKMLLPDSMIVTGWKKKSVNQNAQIATDLCRNLKTHITCHLGLATLRSNHNQAHVKRPSTNYVLNATHT